MNEYVIKLQKVSDNKIIVVTQLMKKETYETLKQSVGKECRIKGQLLTLLDIYPRYYSINSKCFI
jgi:hypothetical protein